MLTNAGVETDSRGYLNQMIKLKRKQEFIGSTLISAYFIFLSLGLALYMIEYVRRGSLVFQLSAYGLSFAWIAFAFFYLAPKGIRKQRKAINEVIARLEEVNGQLGEG